MQWFFAIFPPGSVSLTVLIISLVAAAGLAIGSIRIRGFTLGIPGVMFAGLLASQLLGHDAQGQPVLSPSVLAFVRDFGLIWFVYAVGIQVGPGFVDSLRRRGLGLNLLAATAVLGGAILTVLLARLGHVGIPQAVGLFAGGTTNAPALGSASEALKSIHATSAPSSTSPAIGPPFAISYPFGLLGVILAMVILRRIFRVNVQQEVSILDGAEKQTRADLGTLNIELKNPNLHGLAVQKLADLEGHGVVISRLMHHQIVRVATPDMPVEVGDILLAVGPMDELRKLVLIVGQESPLDLRAMPSKISSQNVLVTRRSALGKDLEELDLTRRLGVAVTRVYRAGMEFTAVGHLRFQFGDRARIVGEPDAITAAAKELGDSQRELNVPRLLPIFVGIAIGVILGCLPIPIYHLPAPVKLGLASGPMLAAIVLSRLGRVGRLIWYMPVGVSNMLREMGIVLFLIAVGLQAGDGFFNALFSTDGVRWLILGAIITILPLLFVGVIGRVVMKMNYLHICGLLAGSMTSPSLAFTQTMTPSEAPAVAFATVYPLTMLMRILCAQLMILIFVR